MDTLFPNIGDLVLAFDAKKIRIGIIVSISELRKVTRSLSVSKILVNI